MRFVYVDPAICDLAARGLVNVLRHPAFFVATSLAKSLLAAVPDGSLMTRTSNSDLRPVSHATGDKTRTVPYALPSPGGFQCRMVPPTRSHCDHTERPRRWLHSSCTKYGLTPASATDPSLLPLSPRLTATGQSFDSADAFRHGVVAKRDRGLYGFKFEDQAYIDD